MSARDEDATNDGGERIDGSAHTTAAVHGAARLDEALGHDAAGVGHDERGGLRQELDGLRRDACRNIMNKSSRGDDAWATDRSL